MFGRQPKQTVRMTYVSHGNVASPIDVAVGDSVMEGAIKNGIDGIVAECGGTCQCGTCHVYVEETFLDRLPPIQDDEDAMLADTTACPRRPNSRLSCQLQVTHELDGLILHTPERQQ
jgi:ferredoxin, 2Fe-2S